VFGKPIRLVLSATMIWAVTMSPLTAEGPEDTTRPGDTIRAEGESLEDGSVEMVLAKLLSTPGLMMSVPSNDQPSGPDRAKLFFEIGRCYYALGDSTGAERVLRYAYALDPSLESGDMDAVGGEPGLARSFVADLSLSQKREHYEQTSKLKAAGRSLIFPGWGQMYRGHKRRGLIGLAATVAAGAFLAKAASDYNSAKSAYDRTAVSELDLEALSETGEIPRPFESRYQTYESKASTANTAAIALAVIWGAVVLDNLFVAPNRFELRWGFGR